MERLHLLGPSPNDLARINTHGLHVVRPEFLLNEGYARFFRERSERGERVFIPSFRSYGIERIDGMARSSGAKTVFLEGQSVPFSSAKKDIRRLHDVGLKVIPVLNLYFMKNDRVHVGRMEEEYENLLDVGADGIGIPNMRTERGNGYGRAVFIRHLVLSKKWRIRAEHYLYELENPGELALYAGLYTDLIRTGLKGFVSERCYIDSRHGIVYTPGRGLLAEPIREFPEPYRHYSQYVLFDLNDETIKCFSMGVLGDDILREFKEELHVS